MRLLICDDEHYIVNYLATLIEDQKYPELEIYKCYSGKNALEIAQTSRIDFMLLDINMPGLTGLEVAAEIRLLLPRCRIIFLTAYDNFENIYASNKLSHTHYLLKTETDEVILKEISNTINELEKENNELLLLSEAQQKSLLLSHLLQQNILKGILAGYSIQKLEREFQLAGSDFQLDLHRDVYLMYTRIHYKTLKEFTTSESTYTLQYLLLIRKLLEGKFLFSMLDQGKGTLLIFFQPVTSFPSEFEFLQSVANDFGSYCQTQYHRHATTILYPDQSGWNEICSHFYMMQNYVDSSITDAPLIFSSTKVSEDDMAEHLSGITVTLDHATLDRAFQELSFYLYQGNCKKFLSLLHQLGAECIRIKSMHSISAIKIYTAISLMLMQYIDLYHLQEKIISKIALYPLYYTQDFSSWKEAYHYLEKISLQIFDILNSKKMDKNEQLVQKIKIYIRDNLDKSLTLAAISRIVNYNESYISRLFKQTSGMGISEFITQERIKKAKELLITTSLSMHDIASASGFDTSQYFSIVFKKSTGISPSEFRRTHLP